MSANTRPSIKSELNKFLQDLGFAVRAVDLYLRKIEEGELAPNTLDSVESETITALANQLLVDSETIKSNAEKALKLLQQSNERRAC